jgi:tripartite-type tricarboxylate transporter receptor subunit TctC
MRTLLFGIFILAGFSLIEPAYMAEAQQFPSRPIQVIIPLGPGSATDIHGRILAEELKNILKAEIIVVNKPGASMTIGTDLVVKSKKDGYTIGYVPTTAITAKAVEPEIVPYDPLKDLEPLGLHAFFPVVIAVSHDAPWKTFKEFVQDAKNNPGKIRVSTVGLQTHASLNLMIIESSTGAAYTQIPYKEGTTAVTSMLGGHVEATFNALSVLIPFVSSGKARILLTTKKMEDFPTVPTMNELGYERELLSPWFAMVAPAGIPEEVKKTLVPAIKTGIYARDVMAKITKIGGSIVDYKSPEEQKSIEMNDLKAFSAVMQRLGSQK